MGTLPKRKYTAELRTQAVTLVRDSRIPQAEAARQLGISEQTLATWMKQARKGHAALFVAGSVTEEQQQIAQLKRDLAEHSHIACVRCRTDRRAAAVHHLRASPFPGRRPSDGAADPTCS